MTYISLDRWMHNSNVQPTSVEAYHHIKKFGIKSQCGLILRLLEQHPEGLSIGEIAQKLNMQRSTVSGRLGDLREIEVIEESTVRQSTVSNYRNKIWVLSSGYDDRVRLID